MGFIAMHPVTHVAEHLKVYGHVHDREYLDHFSDFYDWYLYPVNLPGQLYLWAVEHLFVKNEMFRGELEVAGQTVSLRSITCPVFLLGGEEDDITPWQQVHNMRYAVGSSLVRRYLAPGGHIGLFIGRQSQAEYWTPILAQVRELSGPGDITNALTSASTRTAGGASGKGNGEPNGLLSGWGDLDEAEQILRTRADAGDEWAARRLADLLAQRGDLDGVEQILRARADAGDEWAARRLAEMLAQRGDLDEGEQILQARTDAGDEWAARRLAEMLAEPLAELLADLLAQRGDLDGVEQILRARADGGNESAVSRLAELLAELLARADADDRDATTELAEMLDESGDLDEALQILRARANAGCAEAS